MAGRRYLRHAQLLQWPGLFWMRTRSPVIFRGRRGDTVKIPRSDADYLCRFTKRLEDGRFVRAARGVVRLLTGSAGKASSTTSSPLSWRAAGGCLRRVLSVVQRRARRRSVDRTRVLGPRAPNNPRLYISTQTATAEEALKRIGVLYAIEEEIRGPAAKNGLQRDNPGVSRC